ncbi:unnamed protein product [Alopecurus aequalis]
MPRGFFSFVLRLLRQNGRRRSLIRRRLRGRGVGGLRRYHQNVSALRRFGGRRQSLRRFGRSQRGLRHGLGVRLGGRHGAGPSGVQDEPEAVMPEAQPLPAWILAGQAAPMLHADEVMAPEDMDVDFVGNDPQPAAPPQSLACPVHGWACPLFGQPNNNVEEEVVPVAPMLPGAPSPPGSPDLPSPTPAHELMNADVSSSSVSLGLRLPAPNAASGDVFDNGASRSATPPQSPRRGRFIVPLAVLARAGAGRRLGEWSPASLGLANGHSDGVAPGTRLPDGSSSEEEESAPGSVSRP